MNWLEIINNSVKDQKKILETAKNEGRGLTDEEKTSYENLSNTIKNAQDNLKREKEIQEIENSVKDLTEIENKGPEPASVSNHSDVRVTRNPPLWNSVGEQMIAIANHTRGIGSDERLFKNAATGGNTTVPEDGGFLVGSTDATELWKRTFENSALYKRCRRRPVTVGDRYTQKYVVETSRATGSRFGGIQTYWIDEAGTITASKPKLGLIDIKLGKLAGLYYYTSELLQDAAALTAEVEDWFGEEFAWEIDDKIMNGSGAGQPDGFLNGPATISVAKETGQAADTIVYENIISMWARMWAPARANAVWYINQDIEPQLFTMAFNVGTAGVPVYMPANGVAGTPYGTLMGRPVVPIEQCKTLGDKGDIILADMSQYLVIEKGGLRTDTSIHVAFLTDQQCFRIIKRVNGQSYWDSALTPANGTNTLSPFITLAARA